MQDGDEQSSGFYGEQLLRERIANVLLHKLPESSVSVELTVCFAGPASLAYADVLLVDGGKTSIRGISDVVQELRELRNLMYRTGKGTWFSSKIFVSSTRSIDATYDYTNEPEWDAPISAECYVQDLERFPRDENNRPLWLREKIG